jgi:hypothetical protein
MADETKTFSNISRAQVDKLRSAISAYVTLPESDSGSIESHGMKGSYAYNETAQTLTLSISEAPLFVPRAMIWSTIERALQS